MSVPKICGVKISALNKELIWRTQAVNGKFKETYLPEEKVLSYIKKMVDLDSVEDFKKLLTQPKTCSLYFDKILIAIENYDILSGKFTYFKKNDSHSHDHIDNLLNLSEAQKKRVTVRGFRTVLHAVLKGDYTKIATQMDFLTFDFLALIMEKFGVHQQYLNELIVQRDIISKMGQSMATADDLEKIYEKCESNVCKGALKAILTDRAERKKAQRTQFFANFHRINDKIDFTDEDYMEIVRMHFQSVMTLPNVLSIIKAFNKGGSRIIKQYCQLLGEAVREKKNTFAHHRLDNASRRILKHIFTKKNDIFHGIVLENSISCNIRFVLLMVQLNCFFYESDMNLSGDKVFDLAESFVNGEDLSAVQLRKMMAYIIMELKKDKDKARKEAANRFLYSVVAENVQVLLFNHNFVIDWFDYSMMAMGGANTVKHWKACKEQIVDGSQQFKHALALSEWFAYSKLPHFPECMVDWWKQMIGVQQWKVATQKY